MRELFLRLWTDQSMAIGVLRGLIMVVAELVRADLIPTGGNGSRIAAVLTVLAVSIPAGQMNDTSKEQRPA